MLPNLNPAWSVRAAGFQSSDGIVAVLDPASANVVSITRTGAGVYDILLGSAIDPNDGIFIPSPFTESGTVIFFSLIAITDTLVTLNITNGAVAQTDEIFKFIYFRFRIP